jgi:hypothetical protein
MVLPKDLSSALWEMSQGRGTDPEASNLAKRSDESMVGWFMGGITPQVKIANFDELTQGQGLLGPGGIATLWGGGGEAGGVAGGGIGRVWGGGRGMRGAGGGGVSDAEAVADTSDPNLTGSAYLASQRARFGEEFKKDPELKRQLAALVDLENPKAGVAVVESLMNRMAFMRRSIRSGMGGGGQSFYGPVRRGSVAPRLAELQRNPARLAERLKQIDIALAGSNVAQGYTDQGSAGDPNYIAGGVGVNLYGERFNDWGVTGSRQFRLAQQARVRGEGKTQILSGGQLVAPGTPLATPSAPLTSAQGETTVNQGDKNVTMTVNYTVNLNAGGGLESGVHQYMAANRRFSEDLLRHSKAALS